MPADVLALCGLTREARLFAGPGRRALCGDAATLAAGLDALREPPAFIVSWGLCGGLDPALKAGDLVIGADVTVGGERIDTDLRAVAALTERLGAAGSTPRLASFAAADTPVLTAAAKGALRARTHAAAVDMESALAARFARAHEIPFAILRAVSDPAGRDLPPLVAGAVDRNGRVDLKAVLAGLIRAPGQLPGLIAAGRDSAAAFAALRRAAEAVEAPA